MEVFLKFRFLLIFIFLIACGQFDHKHKSGKREAISTDKSSAAIGPYSQAIKKGNRIYVSGQIGLTKDKELVEGIEAQTKQSMENIKTILAVAEYSMDDIVQCQIFLADINDYQAVNKVYVEYFSGPTPARAVVAVKAIPRSALIEILVVAEK